MDWQVKGSTIDTIELAIYSSVTTEMTSLDGYSLSGVPPILITQINLLPSSAVIAGGVLRLLYPDIIPAEYTLQLAENTPQFRGPRGEYLTSKLMVEFNPAPPPVNSEVTSGVANGVTVEFNVNQGPNLLYIAGTPQVTNVTRGIQSIELVSNANVLIARFAVTQAPGDNYTCAGGIAEFLNVTGGTLNGFDIVI